MREAVMFLAIFSGLASLGLAQEEKGARRRTSFRDDVGVDYWGERVQAKKKAAEKDRLEGASIESIWAEPTRTSDGRTTVYVPPRQVLQFLEEPTKENARAYLAWQEDRMRRLKEASELLREVAEESRTKKTRPKTEERSVPTLAGAFEILYFKKENCPYCAEEDKVLATLAKAHPNVKIRTLTPKDEPGLWREYEIQVVPSLVVASTSGGKNSKVLVRGFMPLEDLVKILQEVGREE